MIKIYFVFLKILDYEGLSSQKMQGYDEFIVDKVKTWIKSVSMVS